MRALLLLLAMTIPAAAQSAPAPVPGQNTLFVECPQRVNRKIVSSPIAISATGQWRAYAQVEVHDGCLHTTRLWVSRNNQPWCLIYMISPTREEDGNGMQILGWAASAQLLLVKTQHWQNGSDGGARESVLAINPATGYVYDPDLDAIVEDRGQQSCGYEVNRAGFASGPNLTILVGVHLFTYFEEGTDPEDMPQEKRCTEGDETWSFSYASGEIKKVEDAQPGGLFKKFVANPKAN